MPNIEERVEKLEKTFVRLGVIVPAIAVFVLVFAGYHWYRIPNLVTEKLSEKAVMTSLKAHEEKAKNSATDAENAANAAKEHETKLGRLKKQQEGRFNKLSVRQNDKLTEMENAIGSLPQQVNGMLNSAQLECRGWTPVGFEKSTQQGDAWCPKDYFITQLDLDYTYRYWNDKGKIWLRTKGVNFASVKCCRLKFP